MKNHFRMKKIDIIEIFRFFFISFFYMLLISFFYSSAYIWDLIPQINVRDTIPLTWELFTMPMILKVGEFIFINTNCETLLINLCHIECEKSYIQIIDNSNINNFNYFFDGFYLDISNPFLYGSKTRCLLE